MSDVTEIGTIRKTAWGVLATAIAVAAQQALINRKGIAEAAELYAGWAWVDYLATHCEPCPDDWTEEAKDRHFDDFQSGAETAGETAYVAFLNEFQVPQASELRRTGWCYGVDLVSLQGAWE